ncbi:hypothetical protein QAD02_021746 [Eretmocerus hayati]|uniref:Uncharacterized protein n=1 Tax=Eretmocerus hayati TaxID=131215 RepID=A0ACC2PS72_9HYME|nr:hypothetical protein QAD02_021746 [Eretmocerus hayati]
MENDADSTAARRNTFFCPWESSPSAPTPVSAARVDHDLPALAPTPVLINETLQKQVLTSADTAVATFYPQALGSSTVSASKKSFRAQGPVFASVPAVNANFCPQAPSVTVFSMGRVDIGRQNQKSETGRRQSLNSSQLLHSTARATAWTAPPIAANFFAQAPGSSAVVSSASSGNFHAQALVSTAELAVTMDSWPPVSTPTVVAADRMNIGQKNQTSETGPSQCSSFNQLHLKARAEASTAITRLNSPAQALASTSISVDSESSRAQALLSTAEPAVNATFCLPTATANVISCGRVNARLQIPTLGAGTRQNLNFSQLSHFTAGWTVSGKGKKRLTAKVNKIIDLLDSKVPLVDEQTQPSDQGQREKSDPVPEKDQEELRSELAQQQAEKICEILQIKFGNTSDQAAEVRGEVNDPSNAASSVNMESVSESHPPGLIKKSCREWHEDFLYKFDKRTGNGTRLVIFHLSKKKNPILENAELHEPLGITLFWLGLMLRVGELSLEGHFAGSLFP